MKKTTDIIRWIGTAIFGIMAVYALSEGGYLGAFLLLLGGAIIAPLDIITKMRNKLKLNKPFSIVIAVVLLFAGVLATPTSEIPTDDPIDSQISESLTDNDNKTDNTSTDEKTEENKSDETTESEDETVSNSTDTTEPEQTEDKTTVSAVGTGKAEAVKLSDIPVYSGNAFVVLNENVPNFSADELKSTGYETYSDLDSLGRTRTAIASVGRDTMPKENEERGSISSIKPTGWVQAKYSGISGGWLYNRCHLIGWQLSAENANKKNLLTGTRHFNVDGMLTFENMVADYIKETGNHVAYRITPIYDGDNLLASGVQMEAYSVEDKGEGICFNVYCYNVQPGIVINYATGESADPSAQTPKEESSSKPTPTPTPKPTPAPEPEQTQPDTSSQTVYTTKTGKKYHSRTNCPGLSNANAIFESTLSAAKNRGLGPCSKCY